MRRIISIITTLGALTFCIITGAAGYKQVYLATGPQEPLTTKASESAIKRTPNVIIYNISADKAVFYEEPKPEEIIPEDDDFYLLAACVEAEAGNQSLLGKRLVADVILNRVDSEIFPDTIHGVIAQPKQFSTYWNGAIDRAEVSEETYKAITMELEERSYPGILFFDCGGYLPYGTPWKRVGDHYFSTL